MNFSLFIAQQWAWLFLLLVPLIIFYFLKLKRPRLEIPSQRRDIASADEARNEMQMTKRLAA